VKIFSGGEEVIFLKTTLEAFIFNENPAFARLDKANNSMDWRAGFSENQSFKLCGFIKISCISGVVHIQSILR